METRKRSKSKRGSSMVEFCLMAPWILFLFMGAFDFGFYAYAIICTENAARVAASVTSANSSSAADSAAACAYALNELNALPNVTGLTTCAALPVQVTATAVNGPDGSPASQVSVTYQTNQLIPIPGLTGKLTLTRTAQMRVKG